MAVDWTQIAMQWTPAREYAAHNPVRVVVAAARFEAAYQAHGLYLPNDQDPTAYKCARFAEFAARTPAEQIACPTVLFRNTTSGVQVRFIQGRHRYRVVCGAGCTEIVVATWGRKSLWFGMDAGIITRFMDNPGHIRPVKIRQGAAA